MPAYLGGNVYYWPNDSSSDKPDQRMFADWLTTADQSRWLKAVDVPLVSIQNVATDG